MTITIDLAPDLATRLVHKADAQGQDVATFVRQLAEREAEENPPPSRTPGLHKGWYLISDDFNAPLPDSFWLGGDGQP